MSVPARDRRPASRGASLRPLRAHDSRKAARMKKIVVLDTNVLLADPNSVLSFPRAEVVIPETVLAELDKLKTARVDPDLRFRGREVSRILFDLSEEGSLVDGVELPDGGLAARHAVRRGHQGPARGHHHAQRRRPHPRHGAAGAPAVRGPGLRRPARHQRPQHAAQGADARHPGRAPRRRRRGRLREALHHPAVPALPRPASRILAVALAVFVGVVFIAVYSQQGRRDGSAMPAEFKALLSADQLAALDALNTLQTNPNDSEALLKMANIYFDPNAGARADRRRRGDQLRPAGHPLLRALPQALAAGQRRARRPRDAATSHTGQTDRAIQEVGTVLQRDNEPREGELQPRALLRRRAAATTRRPRRSSRRSSR